MSSSYQFGCQWCGGPQNGGNCPGCSIVNSGNGFVYDQNPYNETTNFFNQPSHHEIETYSCEYCGGPHQGFECQAGNPLVYEQGPCNNQNFGFDQYPYDSPNHSHQSYGCEYCGGPHYNGDCQTRNPLVYEHDPCNNYDYSYYDQTPQYQTIQTQPPQIPQELLQNCLDILKDLKELVNERAQEESRQRTYGELLAEEQADKVSYRKPLVYDYDDDDEETIPIGKFYNSSAVITPVLEKPDNRSMEELLAEEQMRHIRALYAKHKVDDDYDEESAIPLNDVISQLPQSIAITSVLPNEDPEDSLIMGDEHLSTIPETESSSVESLVPTPSESEGILDHECDVFSPLTNDLVETFSDFDSDYSDADSLYSNDIEFIDALLPLSEIVNLEEDVDHVVSTAVHTTITNPLFEFDSEFTLNSVNPIFDSDESDTETIMDEVHIYSPRSTAHVPPPYTLHEEFSSELTHIISPLEYDCLDGKDHDRGERISICIVMTNLPTLPTEMPSNPKSSTNKIQISATALNPEEENLVMIVIMIFLLFFIYSVTSSLLHSFGNEDTIFDPGIFIYHL